jgi:hypothetical protein
MSAQRALGAAQSDDVAVTSQQEDASAERSHPERDTALDRNESDEPTVLADEAERGEQATTEETEQSSAGDENAAASVLAETARRQAAARVRASNLLPPALRERIAAVVETSGEAAADGSSRVPLEGLVQAVEQSLPDFLRGRGPYDRTEHPGGDGFFHGDGPLSDEAADRIARTQLSNSGLLRGQRVRFAED